jgi:tetratricopeptide (TPR) repeat protein
MEKSGFHRSHGRVILFKVIAVLLPFIVLLLTELVLRAVGYGNDLRLFKLDQTGQYYYMNPQVGKRYFTQEVNATNGNMDFFRKVKKPGTLRIFVLGGSTAFGFPYMFNGAFPRMLKYRLERHYPELNIEMINLSMAAINSYAVLDMAREVCNYQPDAILIYAGQNEYHGTLGIASSSKFGNQPFLVDLFIKSKRLRFMQLIYNLVYSSKKTDRSTDLNLTLMERMAAGQKIPYGSKKYKSGLTQFERNMGKVINLFSSDKIPVFLGTLVTNKRGIHPFISQISNTKIKSEWNQLFDSGKDAMEKGDTIKAYDLFISANKLDSTSAECQYRLGNIAYTKGNYLLAKKYYTNAKELDQLRFRAPEVFNSIIRKVAEGHKNTYITDVASAFDSISPHHIVGNELLLEHVHPNLPGNYLMADTYFKTILSTHLIKGYSYDSIPDEIIKKEMPLTRFDTVFGYISTILLKENWPFNEPLPAPTPAEKTYEGRVAGGLAVKQYSWKTAMEKLFTYYFRKSDFKNALRIAEGQCLEFPFQVTYFERAAKLAQHIHDDDRALFYLVKIWNDFAKNNVIAQQLVVTALNSDRPQLALPYVDFMVRHDSQNQHLVEMKKVITEIIQLKKKMKVTHGDIVTSNSIVDSYLQLKSYKAAQKYIDLSYRLDSTNTKVHDLQIRANKKWN